MTERGWVVLGASLAGAAVAAGAFGAHALKARLTPDLLQVFETGVRYQLAHAVGLIVVGWAVGRFGHPWITVAGWLFGFGILLFSGSLYLYVGSGVRGWAMVTPLGGLLFLAGWIALAVGVGRS